MYAILSIVTNTFYAIKLELPTQLTFPSPTAGSLFRKSEGYVFGKLLVSTEYRRTYVALLPGSGRGQTKQLDEFVGPEITSLRLALTRQMRQARDEGNWYGDSDAVSTALRDGDVRKLNQLRKFRDIEHAKRQKLGCSIDEQVTGVFVSDQLVEQMQQRLTDYAATNPHTFSAKIDGAGRTSLWTDASWKESYVETDEDTRYDRLMTEIFGSPTGR